MAESMTIGLLSLIALGVFLNLIYQYLNAQKNQPLDVHHLSTPLQVQEIAL